MSQLDRHLTTEQLSALLDDQLTQKDEEYDGHLASCQQCQLELAGLRHTVHLLRALPSPALPRSFVLPAGITQITPIDTEAPGEANIHILRSTNSSPQQTHTHTSTQTHIRTRTRRSTGRRILSLAGTLAAVVGILFVLSGLIPSLPQGSMSAGSASTVSSSASTSNGAASSAGPAPASKASGGVGPQNSKPAAEQPQSVQANRSSDPTHTQNVVGIQPAQEQGAEPEAAPPTAASLFDWGATGTRIGLGILLFIAGMMGIAVGRGQSQGIKR